MGTALYQLYDGTLKLHGCKRLLWHRLPIDEAAIQVLDERRRFPFAPENAQPKQTRRPKARTPRRRRRRSTDALAYGLAAALVGSFLWHRGRAGPRA